jgi:hypothetical protein
MRQEGKARRRSKIVDSRVVATRICGSDWPMMVASIRQVGPDVGEARRDRLISILFYRLKGHDLVNVQRQDQPPCP